MTVARRCRDQCLTLGAGALVLGEMLDGVAKLRDATGGVTLRSKLEILTRFRDIFISNFPDDGKSEEQTAPPSSGFFFSEGGVELSGFMKAYVH